MGRPTGIGFRYRYGGGYRCGVSIGCCWLPEAHERAVGACHRNGDGWYEVHPLVRDDVRLRAEQLTGSTAIARLMS